MKYKYLFIPIILFHLLLLIYLKFTAWPEMTVWPYLILKGWVPYRDIAIAHTPLLLVKLAVFYKIFGVGILQLKIFTWSLILTLDLLVFFIAKKLWNEKVALITLSSFVLWMLFFDGNGLWFDLYMGIFALISFFFVRRSNYFWAGIFLALGIISKQTAVFFLIPVGYELLIHGKQKLKYLLALFYGGLVVAVIFLLSLGIFRIIPDFFRWAIDFGVFVLPKAQGQVQLPDLKSLTVSGFPFLIFIPLIWKTRSKNINLLVWAIAGSLGAYPRFEYFHFQPAISYLAIASGLVFSEMKNPRGYLKFFIVLYLLGSFYLFAGYFLRNFQEGTRFYEQDVQDVIFYVDSNTNSNDRIFVLNWWDNIYSLSDRLPGVDPLVPQLSWYMNLPGVQEKMVAGLSQSKPKLIILYPYTDSGLSAYVPQKVYNYVTANYKLKEKVDDLDILIQK